MKAFVFVLALLFFTFTNGQGQTSYTGGGGSSNNTASNPLNWSNGVPTATSIVYINDTSCTSGCTLVFDEDTVFAELHINSTGTTVTLQVMANLTITNAFTFGNPYTYANIYIELLGGGIFEIGSNCAATFYPVYSSSYSIYASDTADNWFINKGAVSVHGNIGGSSTSSQVLYIGSSSSGETLSVHSWGTWTVDSSVRLTFYYLNVINIWGGSFQGSWYTATETSIYFIGNKDIVLQEGAGGDGTVPTFQYANFESSITQYGDYSNPNTLIFNTTGVTVADSEFDAINVVFLADGWLMDCNFTGSALVNSSSTVSGVHAYFVGNNNNVQDSIFAGIGTDFIIQVEYDATVTMTSTFSLYGSVKLINNGTWVYKSGSTLYWDESAWWINLGLLSAVTYDNDWIQESTFPSSAPPNAVVGNLVNMGTIELVSGGGINFHAGTGTFRQCKHGIVKMQLGGPNASGRLLLAEAIMGGYLGFNFDSSFTIYDSGTTIPITWVTPASAVPKGSVNILAKGPDTLDTDVNEIVCWDTSSSTGSVSVFYITKQPTCPTDSYQLLPILSTLDACGDLQDDVKNLQDVASCTASAKCGTIDAGAPTNDGNGGANTASAHVASLAFIVSLICLLLKF